MILCSPEFSESLQEMGTFLLEKTALNDDEESGEWVITFLFEQLNHYDNCFNSCILYVIFG